MSYGITITGLKEAQRALGTRFEPALQTAVKAIALEVQGKVAPYPAATEANSPSNSRGRWYERGYGPRWRRKDGTIQGRKTSQMLGRSWAIRAAGRVGAVLGNRATYARYLHSAEDQARWAAARGWVSDRVAVASVVQSGVAKRIVVQAIRAAMRKG